ncbi:MAG: drug/metabolite transporter, family [Campylobacterota bacterium]|nr:drug/metabolite transporter, family [Campylobacterota bacterium]
MQVNTNNYSYQIAIIALFIAAFGWAAAGVFIKLLPMLQAYEVVVLRFLFAFIFLSIFLGLKSNFKAIIRDLKYSSTWLYGFIMLSCYYMGTVSFQLASVAETTLLMSMAPLFVILYKLLAKQNISLKEKRGFLIAIVGIIILFGANFSNSDYTISRIFGNCLALGVAFLFAVYAILHSQKKEHSPSSISVTYAMLLVALIPSFYFLGYSASINQNMLFDNLLILIGLGIFSTAIPTIAITMASKNLPPVTTSSVLLLETIFGAFLAYLFLNEIFSWYFLISVCVILVGLLLMILKK